jgi:MATE family multidrug resistance protein
MWRRGNFQKTWFGWDLRAAVEPARLKLFLPQACNNALNQALNTWGVDATSLMAGSHLGNTSLAAQSAAYYILFTLNAIQYGISTAVTVRLGQHLGAALPRRAKATVGIGLSLVLVSSGLLSIVVVASRDVVGRIFSSDQAVLAAISDVAPWVATAFMLFGISSLFGAVRAPLLLCCLHTGVT